MKTYHSSHLADSVDSQKLKQCGRAFRKFNLVFLVSALLPMLSVGLFNIAIDPYGIFKSPKFRGLNQVKPHKENHDRLHKAIDIINIKPVTIFLGSSRTKQGLNPTHPALKTSQSVYNIGLNGASSYEMLRYLQHAIKNNKELKMVIVGIDFFMFDKFTTNQIGFLEDRLEKQNIILQDAINGIFSLDALNSSRETIIANINAPNKQADIINGFSPYRNMKSDKFATEWRFKNSIKKYFKLHPNYELSRKHLADFKAIVDTCKQHGITLKVFISPAHAIDEEAIRVTGHWPTVEEWKREIAKIVPFWDFSGYNITTTEPIGAQMKRYADSSHYVEKVGNLVLNRVLSYETEMVPDDFGVLITPANIEFHLGKIRADREMWAKNNQELVKLVQNLKFEQERKGEN